MGNTQKLRYLMIKKLKRSGKWGGAHTSSDNLTKGIPKHMKGEAKKVTKELIEEGLLISKPTSYGLEISLNPKKRGEIEEILRKGPGD